MGSTLHSKGFILLGSYSRIWKKHALEFLDLPNPAKLQIVLGYQVHLWLQTS